MPKAVMCCTLANPGTAGGGISVCRFDLGRMNTISQDFFLLSFKLFLSAQASRFWISERQVE